MLAITIYGNSLISLDRSDAEQQLLRRFKLLQYVLPILFDQDRAKVTLICDGYFYAPYYREEDESRSRKMVDSKQIIEEGRLRYRFHIKLLPSL